MGTGGHETNAAHSPRLGGRLSSALIAVLAVALAASLYGWNRERSALIARVAALSQQNDRAQAVWKAQLSACHAATAPRRVIQTGGASGDAAARDLLARGPEGIDVCARMESADQAVLATLKR